MESLWQMAYGMGFGPFHGSIALWFKDETLKSVPDVPIVAVVQ